MTCPSFSQLSSGPATESTSCRVTIRFLPKRIYVATERQEAEDLLFDTPLEDTEDQEIGEVQEIPTREGFGSDLPSGRRVTITFHAYDGGEKGRHRACEL